MTQYCVVSKSYKEWSIVPVSDSDAQSSDPSHLPWAATRNFGTAWLMTAGPFATEEQATDHALGYMRAHITQEDVTRLKLNWHKDPIWDIEETPGYEAYHDELLTYSRECKAQWDADREYWQQRSTQHNVDKAMNCLDFAGDLPNMTRAEALARAQVHATLALVAELKRMNDHAGAADG